MNPVPLDDFLETYRKRAHLTDPIKTRYPAHVGSDTATTRRLITAIASAERRPQVVFKVLSKLAGGAGIRKALDYISRDGALELAMANEDHLRDNTDSEALVAEWRDTFATRKNGKATNNQKTNHPKPPLEISTPSGLTANQDESDPPLENTLTCPKCFDDGQS